MNEREHTSTETPKMIDNKARRAEHRRQMLEMYAEDESPELAESRYAEAVRRLTIAMNRETGIKND